MENNTTFADRRPTADNETAVFANRGKVSHNDFADKPSHYERPSSVAVHSCGLGLRGTRGEIEIAPKSDGEDALTNPLFSVLLNAVRMGVNKHRSADWQP